MIHSPEVAGLTVRPTTYFSKGERSHEEKHLPAVPQGAWIRGHRAACPPLSVKSAFFTEEVRTTCTVCTRTHRTASRVKLKRVIVCILDFCTPYRPYGLFEVRTRFFSDAYGAIKFALCELDCNSPAGDIFPRSPSESPLHFADRRDESVIVGYYTSGEVHLRSS